MDDKSVVDDHRNMLMVSKKISTFQEQNLKSWAFIFFDNVKEVDVSWNFIKNNKSQDFYPGKIEFNIKFDKGTKIDDEKAQLGMDRLEACTKFLFWNETKVNIKKSGKKWTINKSQPQENQTLPQKK
jgi:hypothetical protein